MSEEKKGKKPVLASEEPPQISPEEWKMGMTAFQRFLKEIEIRIDENDRTVVHVDWVFKFPDEDMAKIFAKTTHAQLGGE